MHRLNRALSGMLVAVALAACQDPLNVENSNNPDRLRVLARPSDLEALIGGAFKTAFNATYGSNGIAPTARTISWESASNLNNWGMGPRSALPRIAIDNQKGNAYQAENNTDHPGLARAARAAADGINRLTVGRVSLGSVAQDARARAWGWFSLAFATGMLAMDYDSLAIVWPYDDLAFLAPLTGHAEGAVAALTELDSAIATATAAQSAAGANNFPVPAGWFYNNATIDAPTFIRICRTYKAYFRANVARTPTERAAVNWAAVRDDAAAGITADISVTTGGGVGWIIAQNQVYTRSGWGQLSLLIGGMADSTGAQYNAWLATPIGSKVPFLVRTRDRRFPAGDTRAAQQTASGSYAAPNRTACARCYIMNRITDTPSDPWTSYYEWYRTQEWWNTSTGTGPTPVLVTPMNDLLRAEALIRLGDIPGAAALIDRTRVPNGLPALTGVVTNATMGVPNSSPTANDCVPRVPVGPTFTTSACGNIMEAMKWEYRLETMYVSYIAQFHSTRGWGDLPEGTPVDWPLPWQELDARRYTTFPNRGGVNNAGGSVGIGTYGF
jgi:hypothetical protein